MNWRPLAIFGTFLVATFATTTGIILDVEMGDANQQITQLQQQIRQDRVQLAAVSAKSSGGHRDLITCADLQAMNLETLLDVSLNTDAGGNLSVSPDQAPVPLPSHCINQ